MYCRDSGFQQYRLQNVYWKEAGEDGKIVLGFAGDINFADDWYTMAVSYTHLDVYKRQPHRG